MILFAGCHFFHKFAMLRSENKQLRTSCSQTTSNFASASAESSVKGPNDVRNLTENEGTPTDTRTFLTGRQHLRAEPSCWCMHEGRAHPSS